MVTIKITERQERLILKTILNEEYGGLSDKVGEVKKYLDDNFIRMTTLEFKDGEPQNTEVVAWADKNKQPLKLLTDVQLFDLIQEKFKNILSDKEERDKFLKQIIKQWYSNNIGKNNTLSAY